MTDPSHQAGSGVGALTWALDAAGVRAPDGTRLRSAEVFAALGGIGFHYVQVGKGRAARVLLHGQAAGVDAAMEPVSTAIRVLGASVESRHWPDVDAAMEGLRDCAGRGAPVLVWVDRGSVPYDPMPRGYQRLIPQLVGVVSVDDDAVVIQDRAAIPLPIDRLRFRLMWSQCSVEPPTALLVSRADGRAVPERLAERLRDGVAAHLAAPLGNRGLAGIRTLASRIRSPAHSASWRRAFARGVPMFHAHAALHRFAEQGAGPGFGRGLFADALEGLSRGLAADELRTHATTWRSIEAQWREIARAALPDDVDGFGEARVLLELRLRRFLDEGLEGSAFLAATSERLSRLVQSMDTHFPLDATSLAFGHSELAGRLDDVAASEARAGEALLALLNARVPRSGVARF